MQCFSLTEKFNPFLTLNSSQNDIVKSGKDEVLKFSARNYLILPNNESWISFGDRPGKTFNLKDSTTAVLRQKLCFIWETTQYSCHGVFTDRSIFSLNLSRSPQIKFDPHRNLSDHCSYVDMSTSVSICARDAALFYPHRIVLM